MLKEVFKMSRHRFCLWHMLKNAAKNPSACQEWQSIDVKLRELVHDSLDLDEFKTGWSDLVKEYKLE